MRNWLAAFLLAATAAISSGGIAYAGIGSGVTVDWQNQQIVHVTLTPNYASGFGAVPAVFGAQPAPTYGPYATYQGGSVDFGSVLAGNDYLYKYAVELNVQTNSSTGFNLYAEGAADFYNTADGTSVPIDQTLYYLPSTDGVTSSDSNTGFSASLPFYRTAGAVSGNSFGTAPTITYGSYPAPAYTTANASAIYYFDYQLKVPPGATSGLYYVWVVYTVVPR